MEMLFIGIDVLKDCLDVYVCLSGEMFVVLCDGKGFESFVERLLELKFILVVVEVIGGFEIIVVVVVVGVLILLVVVNFV